MFSVGDLVTVLHQYQAPYGLDTTVLTVQRLDQMGSYRYITVVDASGAHWSATENCFAPLNVANVYERLAKLQAAVAHKHTFPDLGLRKSWCACGVEGVLDFNTGTYVVSGGAGGERRSV